MRRQTGFGWLQLFSGIFLVILGVYTFFKPNSALTWMVLFYGLLAALIGIGDIVFYVKAERYTGFGPTVALIAGILSVLTGILLVVYPDAGKWVLALFFPIWFIAHCISRLSHLPIVKLVAGRGSYYFSLIANILGLVLGVLMILNPYLSLLSAGYIVGMYLLLLGVDSIAMAFSRMGRGW